MDIKLLDEVKLNKYINKSDTLIVCVSTGIDSMCLFHYLYTNGYKIVVAHVNHKKRTESDQEYAYLEDFCKKNNIPFEGYILDKKIESNFQEEARKIRYSFFINVAKKYNSKAIILAHHADDEVETVIMRIIRGTSIKGYSGIKYITKIEDVDVVRPLLHTNRKTIEEYQKLHNIKFFLDASNNEDHYTRNIIRHNVIPQLLQINPNLYESVKNYSSDQEEMAEYITSKSQEFILNNSFKNENEITFKLKDFNALNTIIKKEVLLEAVNYISLNTVELYHSKTKEILDIINAETRESKTIEIKDDIVFTKEYDDIVIYKNITKPKIDLFINDIGEYEVTGYGKIILSRKNHILPSKNSHMLCYNSEDEIFPIHVRNVKKGDKITYSSITKKVYDLLKEYRVPKRKRENVLVFEHNDEIFFIPKIIRKETDKNKQKIIYITFEEKNNEN
ncbi:tRNA lysidine(34) synthetase TilS [bacterium]|nr:tRNA lysidine(34) synthetase TilS [bacterium]